jgi:hypothetical protein
MNIKELKDFIKDLPDTMPVEFTTSSMYITDKVHFDIEEKGEWANEDTLFISAERV